MKKSIDFLAVLGGIAALLDTVVGALIFLALDLSRTNELVMGISFVLGFPMYLLDVWIAKRIAFCLTGLFFVRWAARCLIGPGLVFANPFVWPVGILLFLALVLLQASKLRKSGVSPN